MAKVKLTKGELKKQRDGLKQYLRYLPTLQLKKQQLQIEILRQLAVLEERKRLELTKRNAILSWAGLLADKEIDIHPWVVPDEVICNSKNIAGVDLPVFSSVRFKEAEYDLFTAPLWVDGAIDGFRILVSLRKEIEVIEKEIDTLRAELRITAQRVNLFEKVKIPEAEENIRLIKIYVGDQMANAVGRSKIAKKKIEQAVSEEVGV